MVHEIDTWRNKDRRGRSEEWDSIREGQLGHFFFCFKRKKSKERETVRIGKDVFDSIGSDLGVKEKKKRWYARVTKKGIRTCSCAHESMGSEASSWELFACGILLSASLYLYTLYVVEPWLRKR